MSKLRKVAAAIADKLLLKLFFWKLDREMAKARKKLRLSKITRDRIAKYHFCNVPSCWECKRNRKGLFPGG